MSKFTLTEINIYPVKSLGGIRLEQSVLTDRGLKYDRRWMLVDRDGKFLTQREHPKMSLLQVSLPGDRLDVQHRHYPEQAVQIPFESLNQSRQTVKIWKSQCSAQDYSKEVNGWFCKQIGIECRLVFMPDDSRREIETTWQSNREIVSFADGFPNLIIGESSLTDLNDRLERPVSMDRFRSNFVFSGGSPFSEDNWSVIRIGDVVFRVVKPCPRCVLTTVDPQTGNKGIEPLRTLATYRRDGSGGIMFGQNLLHDGLGELRVGMPIEVLE